jgi:uncharacterized damage-inducible protein DinB
MMKRALVSTVILGWLCTGGAARALAQAETKSAVPAATAKDIRAQFLGDLKEVEEKMVGLAQATPQEKFTWRPQEGVRSMSEVFLHLAGGNFGFPNFWGVKPPEGIQTRGFDKSTTDKAKVIELMKQSYDHMRKAVEGISDADLDKSIKFFGQPATLREVLFDIATHSHEHLGQAIAYARMNGVVPPWTAERQAKQAAAPKK